MYNFEGLLEFYRGGGGGKIGCQSECNTERGFIDSLYGYNRKKLYGLSSLLITYSIISWFTISNIA